jgi:hypothetical protein
MLLKTSWIILSFILDFNTDEKRRKPVSQDVARCRKFNQPANSNSNIFALKSKEKAKQRIKIHKYTCLRSKKHLNDFQDFFLVILRDLDALWPTRIQSV